jgi:hypothetical protein
VTYFYFILKHRRTSLLPGVVSEFVSFVPSASVSAVLQLGSRLMEIDAGQRAKKNGWWVWKRKPLHC